MSHRRTLSLLVVGAGLSLIAGRGSAATEPQLSIRGYVELLGTARELEEGSRVNPGNLLGLKETGGEARADFNLGVVHGGLRLFAEGYGAVDLRDGDSDPQLYQGYLSFSTPSKQYFVRAGKVVPGWGVGQIWNPVRTFENRRDLVFPDQAIEGVWIAEAQRFFSTGSITVLLLPPERSVDPWGYGLRLSSAIESLDYSISLVGAEGGALRGGVELSLALGRATLVAEAALVNRSQALVLGEEGQTRPRGEGNRLSYVLGGNITLPHDFLLVLEHYHDDEALDRGELGLFLDHLPRSGGLYNPFGNGQDNFFLGLSRLVLWHDSSIALNSFYNRQGEIGVVQLKGESQLGDKIRLIVSYLFFTESEHNTPVNLFGNSLQARLKWSF